MSIQLTREVFENSIGNVKQAFNEPTVEAISGAYNAVINLGDNNALVEQFIEQSKSLQNTVNGFLENADEFIKETQNYCDLTDYMNTKASIGEVTNRDVDVDIDKADVDAIMV
ncbi:hypothetical protein [Paraclostridium bifermentans]|uniref:hypothetical protein n=1 Tax=Paraclostridium bifermentans TaxID=1490 RepID=UPI00374FD8B9